MDLNLGGKRAIVCGCTQGIGKAVAIELALLGASVTLVARNEAKLKNTAMELHESLQQKHEYITADFSDPGSLKNKIATYLKDRTIQILINNTGGPPGGLAVDAGPEEFSQAFANHLICNQILMQACLDGMKAAKYGRIINIISTSAKTPMLGLGVSNTIRGAVANWAKTISVELGEFGITVNNVLPGATMTARLQSLIRTRSEQSGKTEVEITDNMIKEIPAGRIGDPREVAVAAAFLATPAAGYINGINLPVDGGRTACL
jgi:3-oxoacyl-[acyl-carrier protein] reductase